MSTILQFKLTQAGLAAVWNATNTGMSLNLTHVQFGSGRRVPTGTELALVSPKQATPIAAGFSVSATQIRMSAIFGGNLFYTIGEVGLWAGDPAVAGSKLVAYYSGGTDLAIKTPGVDFIFSHDMTLNDAVPAGGLIILADSAQSAMLAMIMAHEAATNPHPQYLAEISAMIAAHEAAANPHPQYLTAAEFNALLNTTQLVQTGMSFRWPSSLPAPTGYLMRNGAAISRTAYAALFAVIGTAFGVGNGSTTFNLPDDRDRMSIGAGNLYALGAKGGSSDAVVVSHSHPISVSVTDPSHSHYGTSGNNIDVGIPMYGVSPAYVRASGPSGANGSASTTGISVSATSSSAGVGSTNANLPPYLAEYGIIKY